MSQIARHPEALCFWEPCGYCKHIIPFSWDVSETASQHVLLFVYICICSVNGPVLRWRLFPASDDGGFNPSIYNSNAHVCSTEMDYTEHWRHRMMHRKNTQIRWMTWRKEIQIGVYACWNVLRVWCRHMLIYIYIIIQYIININMHDIDIMVTSKIKWVINY